MGPGASCQHAGNWMRGEVVAARSCISGVRLLRVLVPCFGWFKWKLNVKPHYSGGGYFDTYSRPALSFHPGLHVADDPDRSQADQGHGKAGFLMYAQTARHFLTLHNDSIPGINHTVLLQDDLRFLLLEHSLSQSLSLGDSAGILLPSLSSFVGRPRECP